VVSCSIRDIVTGLLSGPEVLVGMASLHMGPLVTYSKVSKVGVESLAEDACRRTISLKGDRVTLRLVMQEICGKEGSLLVTDFCAQTFTVGDNDFCSIL
jgi:hypothetical protein